MSKFKNGDKIICTNTFPGTNAKITVGKIYTVYNLDGRQWFEDDKGNGWNLLYDYNNCFEVYTEKQRRFHK